VTLAGFHVSRSSAVAAGFLLAAGALAQPVLALVAALPAAVLALRSSPFAPASSQRTAGALAWSRRAAVHRLALVFGSALVFGLPGTRPFFQAISWAEATGGMLALRPADAAWSGAVFLAFVLGFAMATRLTRAAPAVALGISLAAAVVLVARVHRWMAAGQLPPAEHYRLRRAALEAPALAPLCLPGAPPGDWIAAIAQRPPGERAPWIPPVYRDEWDARLVRPCVHWPR
jgi:hypothetical protein